MDAERTRAGTPYLIALALVVALTAVTRLPAPWRLGVLSDEMLHLESFRNHYRTDDIYPVFMQRAERVKLLEGERLELLRKVYDSGPLAQRACCVITDLHPPTFPVMGEVIEAITHSSLLAFRIPSLIASVLAVLFMERLGRELRDRTLGLWLATLLAGAFMAQMYAGVARPYALAQCALILAMWMFARDRRLERRSPWRFLLAALFAQSTNWLVWPMLGTIVALELGRRLRAGTTPGRLLGQIWWYALASVAMLPILALHLQNPATYGNTDQQPIEAIWYHLCLASPLASLDHVLGLAAPRQDQVYPMLSPAGFLLLLPALAGIAAMVADGAFCRERPDRALAAPSVRGGLVLMLVAALLTAIFVASAPRMAVIYVTVPMVLAGIGLRYVLRSRVVSELAIAVVVVAMLVLRFGWPEDPYRRAFSSQTDYRPIAHRVEALLEDGGTWTAYPRALGDCLYRYADLPEPEALFDLEDFRAMVEGLPERDEPLVILARLQWIEGFYDLRFLEDRWDYPNRISVVRVP